MRALWFRARWFSRRRPPRCLARLLLSLPARRHSSWPLSCWRLRSAYARKFEKQISSVHIAGGGKRELEGTSIASGALLRRARELQRMQLNVIARALQSRRPFFSVRRFAAWQRLLLSRVYLARRRARMWLCDFCAWICMSRERLLLSIPPRAIRSYLRTVCFNEVARASAEFSHCDLKRCLLNISVQLCLPF